MKNNASLMREPWRRSSRRQGLLSAFTLIELLVVSYVFRDAVHAKVPLKAELLYPTMAGRLNATAAFQAPAFLGRKV